MCLYKTIELILHILIGISFITDVVVNINLFFGGIIFILLLLENVKFIGRTYISIHYIT